MSTDDGNMVLGPGEGKTIPVGNVLDFLQKEAA